MLAGGDLCNRYHRFQRRCSHQASHSFSCVFSACYAAIAAAKVAPGAATAAAPGAVVYWCYCLCFPRFSKIVRQFMCALGTRRALSVLVLLVLLVLLLPLLLPFSLWETVCLGATDYTERQPSMAASSTSRWSCSAVDPRFCICCCCLCCCRLEEAPPSNAVRLQFKSSDFLHP